LELAPTKFYDCDIWYHCWLFNTTVS